MSKTVFKLRSIRSKNDFGKAQTYSRMNVISTAHQISPLSITNQLFREHQAGISEGHHRVLRESRRTNHPVPPPSLVPLHNSDHEANQARYRSCCHRKYLLQHFASLKGTANKGACQIGLARMVYLLSGEKTKGRFL